MFAGVLCAEDTCIECGVLSRLFAVRAVMLYLRQDRLFPLETLCDYLLPQTHHAGRVRRALRAADGEHNCQGLSVLVCPAVLRAMQWPENWRLTRESTS